ncbi:MAG: hypothetical protein ACJ77A_03975 [Actinomycetota bacterium]
MRRGTLITVILLFLLLVAAAIYQLTLGTRSGEPFCGPASPGALPTATCVPPTSTSPT